MFKDSLSTPSLKYVRIPRILSFSILPFLLFIENPSNITVSFTFAFGIISDAWILSKSEKMWINKINKNTIS